MQESSDRCILVIDESAAAASDTADASGSRRIVVAAVAAATAYFPHADLILLATTDWPSAMAQLRVLAPDIPVLPLGDRTMLDAALPALLDDARARREAARQLRARHDELEHGLRLLREDEEAGRRVQQRILPASPRAYGSCVIEHRVLPSLFLSGDFVDHFEIAPGRVVFYLADVSGHGTSSAFITVLLKTLGNRARRVMQQSLQQEGQARPSILLELANRELLALGLGKHVTMFCGVLDAGRRELCYAVAGHYPQPIVFDGKCAEYLGARGMPVGLFDEAVYEDRMHALPTGFALVLLSDGLMELLSETSLADKEARLLQVVGSGAVTVETLSREFALDGRQDLPDDIAMLVVRDVPSGTPAG
ncbi:MAG: PP2C family protein-serine/threonine phosphatase [Pseudomonadota bacterium]